MLYARLKSFQNRNSIRHVQIQDQIKPLVRIQCMARQQHGWFQQVSRRRCFTIEMAALKPSYIDFYNPIQSSDVHCIDVDSLNNYIIDDLYLSVLNANSKDISLAQYFLCCWKVNNFTTLHFADSQKNLSNIYLLSNL